jgi:hypothetical protein
MERTWSPAVHTIKELVEMILKYELNYESNTILRLEIDFWIKILAKSSHRELQQFSKTLSHFLKTHTGQSSSPSNSSSSSSSSSQKDYSILGRIWIIKPIGLSCGTQIHITTGLTNILQLLHTFTGKCIIQKYIERPLLIRNQQKFDIRQWILITSLHPLILYGFSECYLRLSTEKYQVYTWEDLQNTKMHLTNYAIQKIPTITAATNTSDTQTQTQTQTQNSQNKNRRTKETIMTDIIVEEAGPSMEEICPVMMSQAEFDHFLSHKYYSSNPSSSIYSQFILPQIQTICIESCLAIQDRLQEIQKGFEWLGVDLMITEDDLQVRLIEINTSPDISYSTMITERLVKAAVHDLNTLWFDCQFQRHSSTAGDGPNDGGSSSSEEAVESTSITIEKEATEEVVNKRNNINDRSSRKSFHCNVCQSKQADPHWCCWYVESPKGEGEDSSAVLTVNTRTRHEEKKHQNNTEASTCLSKPLIFKSDCKPNDLSLVEPLLQTWQEAQSMANLSLSSLSSSASEQTASTTAIDSEDEL